MISFKIVLFLKIFLFWKQGNFLLQTKMNIWLFLKKTFCLVHVEVQETYVSEDVRNGGREEVRYRETY